MRALAVLLAAGQGIRLGQELPKALVRLRGRSLYEWSEAALLACAEVEAIQPVLPAGLLSSLDSSEPRRLAPVVGGARRQDSVLRGLEAGAAAMPHLEWVLVHDSARCLVEPDDASAVLRAAQATGAALPIVPASDTPKWLAESGGRVERTRKEGNRMVHEEYSKQDNEAEFTVVVGERFVVSARGRGVPIDALRSAVGSLDLARLEAMKAAGARK